MRIRGAELRDAPALGHLVVESWLAAHRGQVPDAAWQKRLDEWTPEVSGRAWARLLGDRIDGNHDRTVLMVAEEGGLAGLLLASDHEGDDSGVTAEVDALYVRPALWGHGVGRLLLQRGAAELVALGFSRLRLTVLAANYPACGFYAVMGGRVAGRRTIEEEGFLLPGTVYEWPDLRTLVATEP